MSEDYQIVVLCGGISEEREVSLVSGRSLFKVLEGGGRARLCQLDENVLPEWVEGRRHVVFPAMHGAFGEDGGIQALLESRGVAYAGCGVEASRLCMDKVRTKACVRAAGVPVDAEVSFVAGQAPSAAGIVAQLGAALVVKPMNKGSSVGLYLVEGEGELAGVLASLDSGEWMVERRVKGRELTVGILEGEAAGVVEVVPAGGVYDFRHKYTAGMTEYRVPAPLGVALERAVKAAAVAAFRACGCRDFARVDFILDEADRLHFLEINTLPGLTPTSLLPKSASCLGLDFPALAVRLLAPALGRFRERGLVKNKEEL